VKLVHGNTGRNQKPENDMDLRRKSNKVNVIVAIKCAALVLILVTVSSAQEGFAVHSKGKQQWPESEAQRIYTSACEIVQREYGATRAIRPQLTLVLGADRNVVAFDQREIRLTKWDRYLFAQGVVLLAFGDLMPLEKKMAMTKRALSWAESTVGIQEISK
jgi:hypothetical protein